MSPAAKAQGICLRLLTARPRSRAELADALRRRGIPEEVGEPVLDRLTEVGLVDDAAFAESVVHSEHRHRGLGRRALSTGLRRRGVPDEIVREVVATVRPEDEEQRARELVRRKLRTSTVRDARTLARNLGGVLARKGYSEELAWRVVRDELGPDDCSTEVEPRLD
ncbi:MAG: regulatory protein RecX [Pseudonocardiales bacterium]|nr:regulatory protein RecX [Pseudonocardiales bacterium]MBV9728634.1 regulatory protein RecX [Pseudonocardiales bacterium]